MVKQLRDLMVDATDNPPEEPFLAADLLHHGRRRVRRRRAGVVAGATAVVAIMASVPFVLTGTGSTTGQPAKGSEPVGPVLSLGDATRAVEGRDYDVLATLVNPNLNRTNGSYFTAVLADGTVVVQQGPRGINNRLRWGILDPETDLTTWLPRVAGKHGPYGFLGEAEDGRLVFRDDAEPRATMLYTIRPGDSTWELIPLDTEQFGIDVDHWGALRLADGDRIFLSVDVDGKSKRVHLRSTTLAAPDVWVDHGTVGATFAVRGSELTWTTRNRPDSVLRVRDLDSGQEQRVDMDSGTRCNNLSFERVRDALVIGQYCGTTKRVRDDRVQIVGVDGRPVVTIRGDGLDVLYSTDDHVVMQAYTKPLAGTYVYSFADSSLKRLTNDYSMFCCATSGLGDRLSWATPYGGTFDQTAKDQDGQESTSTMQRGNKLWIADFR